VRFEVFAVVKISESRFYGLWHFVAV